MTRRKSKSEDIEENKPDNSVKVTIVSTIGLIVVTLITALVAPAILNSLDRSSTPLPTAPFSTITTTLLPIDTAAPLSNVFEEDFTNGSKYWNLDCSKSPDFWTALCSVDADGFRWVVTGKRTGYLASTYSNLSASDFDLEMTLDLVDISSPAEYFKYGIVFRRSDPGSYVMFIDSNNEYSFYKYIVQEQKWDTLMKPTKLATIQANGKNTFRVECRGSKIRLYINGGFVGDFNDDSFSNGTIGIASWMAENRTMVFSLNSFKITLPSP